MEINQLQGARVYANAPGPKTAVENTADTSQDSRLPGNSLDTRPGSQVQEPYEVKITQEARDLAAQETDREQQALVPAEEKSNPAPPPGSVQTDRSDSGSQRGRQAIDIVA